MKLTQEERERIRTEAYENALEIYHFESEAVRGQYAEILIKGMEYECLKKNEEIERLMNKLIEWQHIASDMQKSSREFESKLQASEERIKELEKELSNIRSNYTLRSRNSEQ